MNKGYNEGGVVPGSGNFNTPGKLGVKTEYGDPAAGKVKKFDESDNFDEVEKEGKELPSLVGERTAKFNGRDSSQKAQVLRELLNNDEIFPLMASILLKYNRELIRAGFKPKEALRVISSLNLL